MLTNCRHCSNRIANQPYLKYVGCNFYFHAKCANLPKSDLSERCNKLREISNSWICFECLNASFPFHSINDRQYNKLFDLDNKKFKCNSVVIDSDNIFGLIEQINETFTHDLNLIQGIEVPCNYISAEHLKSFCETTRAKNPPFILMNVNVRSLVNNQHFASLETMIAALEVKPDVLGINETWEKSNSTGPYRNLQNYNLISNFRKESGGGGVGITLKKE